MAPILSEPQDVNVVHIKQNSILRNTASRQQIDFSLMGVLSVDKHCRQLVSHFLAQHPVLTNTDKIVY